MTSPDSLVGVEGVGLHGDPTHRGGRHPRLLDLFCCAGLASDGYTAAGFNCIGIDIDPQPRYPYAFYSRDAVAALRERWALIDTADAIHASPPCQAHTRAGHLRTAQGGTSKFDDLLTPTLHLLRTFYRDMPWVVENVPGAPWGELQPGEYLTTLCGSSFGLGVRRHREFLTNWPLIGLACDHKGQGRPWGVYHVPGDSIPQGGRTARDLAHGKQVMGVPEGRVITWGELKEGLPPAYTEWIGRQLARVVDVTRHSA